jgi:hypothetical protein
MKAMAEAEFMVQYGLHHFQAATIVNEFGAVIVGEPNRSSDGANPASPVKVAKASPARLEKFAAENEEVANAKAAKYDSFLPLPEVPGLDAADSLAVRRVYARQVCRRQAGKADVDGESTDDVDPECDARYAPFRPTVEEVLAHITTSGGSKLQPMK